MSKYVGVLRRPDGLATAAGALAAVPVDATTPHRRSWEATNLLTVATAVVDAAAARTESRGCHRRTDHPEPRAVWLTHIDVRLAPDSPGSAVVALTGVADPAADTCDGGPVMLPLHDLSERTHDLLVAAGLDPDSVRAVVRLAIEEDLAGGIDVTSTATVRRTSAAAASSSHARRRRRGLPGRCRGHGGGVRHGPGGCRFELLASDGDRVTPGSPSRCRGPTRAILTAERSALNLLCHISGRRDADATVGRRAGGTTARVRDTRKTMPGLRALEKYGRALRRWPQPPHGPQRRALVKDNHVLAAGGVAEAFAAVRRLEATIPVEIEVDSLDGLAEAITAGADVVLLDNFEPEQMAEAVRLRAEMNPSVVLEASGGLTVDSARRVGETGVDFIAVGELTHSARVFDIGLDLRAVV
jgi:nicotinate-nucleotide pyrophosphorylase (carboxylating)